MAVASTFAYIVSPLEIQICIAIHKRLPVSIEKNVLQYQPFQYHKTTSN